jgi:putative membrane protein
MAGCTPSCSWCCWCWADHHACGRLLRKFTTYGNQHGHVWYRWFNEAPVLMLLAAVVLVVVKPF